MNTLLCTILLYCIGLTEAVILSPSQMVLPVAVSKRPLSLPSLATVKKPFFSLPKFKSNQPTVPVTKVQHRFNSVLQKLPSTPGTNLHQLSLVQAFLTFDQPQSFQLIQKWTLLAKQNVRGAAFQLMEARTEAGLRLALANFCLTKTSQ